ncbi:MAG: hypothetical protein JNK15_12620 [Planctomycetes bacterium]|nr:hypothetical protein [Planctomycetota bacterium]
MVMQLRNLLNSGQWFGTFAKDKVRQTAELHLRFLDGRMEGWGRDEWGEFLVDGTYDLATEELRWTQLYPEQPRVFCRGFLEPTFVWGVWTTADGKKGTLKLLPANSQTGNAPRFDRDSDSRDDWPLEPPGYDN